MGSVLPSGDRRTHDGDHNPSLMRQLIAVCIATALFLAAPTAQRREPSAAVAPPGLDLSRFDEIPPVVQDAIRDKKLPGAVVLIGRGDRVVYQKAIGHRAVEPSLEPMTTDTIFD